MPRDHFKKVFYSPYFQSEHYKNESPGGVIEKRLESLLKKLFKKEKKK
jgi:hypothetical protein